MAKTVTRKYKYRIYPNKTQRAKIYSDLRVCTDLYNATLKEKKRAYDEEGINLGAYDLINRKARLGVDISSVYSQVTTNVCQRVDNAFTAFFRRCKRGEKAGYPRFKSYDRYDSFTYPQYGFKFVDDKRFSLGKIGVVKIIKHRDLPEKSKIKTCDVIKNALGQLFVCLTVDVVVDVPDSVVGDSVGIDLGCQTYATLSTGEKIEHPHYYKRLSEKLAKAQSRWDKLKKRAKDDKQKSKAKRRKNKLETKIKNQRQDFLHKTARKLVNSSFGTFYVEDLNIKGMTKDNYRNLNKSILDSGWGNFLDMLTYKAEEAGKKVVRVNPAYTSQICSGCGWMVKKDLSVRQHTCPRCGLSIDRDVNAAINILSFGTKLSGSDTGRSL